MTLARREPLPTLGPSPFHRHRGPWVEHWRPGVWMTGAGKRSPNAEMVHGRITVRIRRCQCGRVDVREKWAGGKRKSIQ